MHLVTWLLFIAQITCITNELAFSRCCGEKELFHYETWTCITNPHITNLTEILSDVIYNLLKIPFERREAIQIYHNALSSMTFEITKVFLIDADYTEKRSEVWKYMGHNFIDNVLSCFDFSITPNPSIVMVWNTDLKPIHKCCKKSERLSNDASRCEPIPGENGDDISTEIINSEDDEEDYHWIPESLPRGFLKVQYNFMKDSHKLKSVMKAKENEMQWEILPTSTEEPALIQWTKSDVTRTVSERATDSFCFDEVAEGPFAPRVLIALEYDVRKCCAKGMQISHDLVKCAPRPGILPQAETVVEKVNWQTNPKENFWIPDKLRNSDLNVKYLNEFPYYIDVIYNEDKWKLEKYLGAPAVTLNITFLSGEPLFFRTREFCFDFIADAQRVLLVHSEYLTDFDVRKCCYPGEIISPTGYCVKHDGPDWTPGSSEASRRYMPRGHEVPTESMRFPLKWVCQGFHTYAVNASRALQYFGGKTFETYKWKVTSFCSDLQQRAADGGGGGGVEEVVGSCDSIPSDDYFEAIRPLGVVSAALFAAAATTAVARTRTRRTAHGRALACHAFCLAVTNALQATWFFTTPGRSDKECQEYAYSIYFFMTAANFWLTAVNVNMVKGFRRPLGAMATALRDGGAVVRKRFALMSVFAWGGPLLLTSVAVTMHVHKERIQQRGFVVPSFFETRTCTLEVYYDFRSKRSPIEGRLGALCYYYAATALLVVTNGVCVFLTARTVRDLQRDKRVLTRHSSSAQGCLPQETLQNALLHTKLLLSAGIAELLIEAVGWAFGGPRRSLNNQMEYLDSWQRAYVFGSIATFVDLVRAITIFWLCSGRNCNYKEVARRIEVNLLTVWEGLKRRFYSNNEDIELR